MYTEEVSFYTPRPRERTNYFSTPRESLFQKEIKSAHDGNARLQHHQTFSMISEFRSELFESICNYLGAELPVAAGSNRINRRGRFFHFANLADHERRSSGKGERKWLKALSLNLQRKHKKKQDKKLINIRISSPGDLFSRKNGRF